MPAARGKNESADKPDFVALARARRRPSIWAHRRRVPRAIHPRTRASSPRPCAQPHRLVRPSILLRAGFTEPPRSPAALVRSYRTVSPSPPSTRGGGGLFSVALSRGSPRVAVSNRPALRSPDFPRLRPAGSCRRFRKSRPSGRLVPCRILEVPRTELHNGRADRLLDPLEVRGGIDQVHACLPVAVAPQFGYLRQIQV